MDYQALKAYAHAHQDEMVAALEDLVSRESPSTDKAHLDRLASHLATRWREVGATADVIENPKRGNHLRVLFPARISGGEPAPALLLGHFDTVWPVGTLAERPFRVEQGRAWGPGTFDMKGGLVIAEFALRAVYDLGLPLARPVMLLLNSDEEIGSGTSRRLIEAAARDAAYVLVLEPAVPGGALKTARKGVGGFTLRVTGRASHAGAAPEEGVSAIVELAQQILRLHELSDSGTGTTVNVGVIQGGTRSNVIAAHAEARIDVRSWTKEDLDRVAAKIRALQPFNAATTVTVSGGIGRPPMERTADVVALYRVAEQVGSQLGLAVEEGASGGGSDGNYTAAMGVPTLDGLGPVGDGAHAIHEHVEVASLPARAALLAGLLCEAP